MKVIYRVSQGTQAERPEVVDESSAYVVRLRKNIERIEKEDPSTGEKVQMWQYEEAVLTREEYARKVAYDNAAKIEYVAMMADIDIEGE